MRNKNTNNLLCLMVALTLLFSIMQPNVSKANENKLELLRQTSDAFSSVAAKAVPAVVFIKVERTIEKQMTVPGTPYGFNDPFGFFGDEFNDRFFRGRQPSQPKEYRQMGQGSGFIIGEEGYILTNNHVVGKADVITVKLHDGREFDAKLIGTDEKSDVAVIKIEGNNLPILPLGDSDELKIGEWVIAIGNPFGLAETLTSGIVSAKGRSTVGINDYEDFIQTDAAINPGNSGGPLINIEGKAIGINTAIFSNSGGNMGIGFAIPINMAKIIKERTITVKIAELSDTQVFADTSQLDRRLGLTVENLTEEASRYYGLPSNEGVIVSNVNPNSYAYREGIRPGMIILSVNRIKVDSVEKFNEAIRASFKTKKVLLLVRAERYTRFVVLPLE